LVKTLLDPVVTMEPAFQAEEERRLRAGKPSRIYDVTAWNIPLMFGVAGWRAASLPSAKTVPSAPRDLKRAPIAVEARSAAWVVRSEGFSAARVLAAWLEAGVRVRVATEAFSIGDAAFDAGTFVALAERNPADVMTRAAVAAADLGVDVLAFDTLKTRSGPGLGTSEFVPVPKSRVAVGFGAPFDVTSAGSMRRFLQQSLGVPGVDPLGRPRGRRGAS
jgi:hypothetical protein